MRPSASLTMPALPGAQILPRRVPVRGHRHTKSDPATAAAAPSNTAGRGDRIEKLCRNIVLDAIPYLVRSGNARRQLLGVSDGRNGVRNLRVLDRRGVWHRVVGSWCLPLNYTRNLPIPPATARWPSVPVTYRRSCRATTRHSRVTSTLRTVGGDIDHAFDRQ